ncbi:MAG: hypothetical protein AAF747_05290 [Planctomycetota bacterium]
MTKISMLTIALVASAGSAQVIDFESLPTRSTPSDNTELDRDMAFYSNGVGVTFGFDTDGDRVADLNAIIEETGNNRPNGFFSTNAASGSDTPMFAGLGSYFLRHQTANGDNPHAFIISFDQPVAQTTGEIWDLDGRNDGTYEQWLVTGFDSNGSIVDQIESPIGLVPSHEASLDSMAWMFALTANPAGDGINHVVIEHIGTAQGVGLAFDNFTAVAVPTPAAAAMLGIAGLGAARRRR